MLRVSIYILTELAYQKAYTCTCFRSFVFIQYIVLLHSQLITQLKILTTQQMLMLEY